nr:cell wall hydrolase [Novosphingobium profundi]
MPLPPLAQREQALAVNAAVPFAVGPLTPPRPLHWRGYPHDLERAIDCLASAEYYEAGQDEEGQRAVAQVVLNRVRHPAFPNSVCAVVYEGAARTTGCQFTFTCDGSLRRRPIPAAWDKARGIARAALGGAVFTAVGLATHYHTDWVHPAWSSQLAKIAQVRTHIFLRWPGAWGRPAAFSQTPSANEPREAKLAPYSPVHRIGLADGAAGPAPATALRSDHPAVMDTLPNALPGLNLRGSKLALVHPQGDAFGFLLPSTYPGAFGLLALDVCRARDFCKVMGWTQPDAIPKGFPVPLDSRRRLAFLYVHDRASHREVLGWDCTLFPRKDPGECLDEAATRWDAVMPGLHSSD